MTGDHLFECVALSTLKNAEQDDLSRRAKYIYIGLRDVSRCIADDAWNLGKTLQLNDNINSPLIKSSYIIFGDADGAI